MKLRQWQAAALDKYEKLGEPSDFLVTATPGAGKTTFALTFATRLLDNHTVDRVIVVVPTDHLRKQWSEAAEKFGITLEHNQTNDKGRVPEECQGYVATYAQVAAHPLLHKRHCDRDHKTLVILDEIHHAGDGLLWGEGILEAFEDAPRRLSLTGTPFRTSKNERIPFVRYAETMPGTYTSEADYTYGYSHALADNVVRPVVFAAYSGVSRWKNSAGDIVSVSLSEQSTKETETLAWRTALNPAGEWIPHVIAAAHDRLTEIRETTTPDAAGMVLASDQDTAKAYAKVITKITGKKPALVLSEDSKASARIASFSASDEEWLVAVRMVSEGVDVPRLTVGVYATSYRTPLFFAQAIGRFVRARDSHEIATVFLPAVRPLLALAAEMEQERDHVLETKTDPEEDLLEPVHEHEETEPDSDDASEYEALSAEAEFAHILYRGKGHMAHPGAPSRHQSSRPLQEDEEEYLGLPGLLDPTQVATLLRQREHHIKASVAKTKTGEETPGQVQKARQRAVALKKEINSLVASHAHRTKKSSAQIHREARLAVPGPPTASAPLDVLEDRRDWLLAQNH